MSHRDRLRWDAKYLHRREMGQVSTFLREVERQLPVRGSAIDLACGDGANSIWLAQRGLNVTAVDISDVGIDIGRSRTSNMNIQWVSADLDEWRPEQLYELAVVIRYWDRHRLPTLVRKCLADGGLLLLEAFHQNERSSSTSHVTNPDYLMRAGEWNELFSDFDLLIFDQTEQTSRFLARRL